MAQTPIVEDRTRSMDEKAWWDLWNKSYRSDNDGGEIATELFARTSAVVNEITGTGIWRMLEVGCGAGALSRLLNYSTYHGLDISPAAIEIACQKSADIKLLPGRDLPTYEAADFHDWPVPSEPFDIAVCVDAVMCFRDQKLALQKVAQSLRDDGSLILTAINPFVYNRIRRTQTTRIESGPVSRWLTGQALETLIRSAGFTIDRSYTMMPRGNMGILRFLNAYRLNHAFGPVVEAVLKRFKEKAGLGQYRVIVARKGRQA
jgi:SAM-dependent methyltransferase